MTQYFFWKVLRMIPVEKIRKIKTIVVDHDTHEESESSIYTIVERFQVFKGKKLFFRTSQHQL